MTDAGMEYARALFDIAREKNATDEWLECLRGVEALLKDNPGYVEMLASPLLSARAKGQRLDEAFATRLPEEILSFLKLFAARGHIASFSACADAFEQLNNDYRGVSPALVESAAKLTDAQLKRLQEKLEKRFSRKLILTEKVVPELLGGLRIQIDGTEIDGTLRGRLRELEEVMNG